MAEAQGDSVVEWLPDSALHVLQVARHYSPVLKLLSLGVDVIQNIRRWWKGEISGKRCVKNIIDSGVGVTVELACDLVGHASGYVTAGSTIGRVAGHRARSLSDRLTQWLFGLPKSEALENAYNFLHLKVSASNSEINSAYRKLALQYHPDKVTGNRDKWLQLQYYIAIIRESRGQY